MEIIEEDLSRLRKLQKSEKDKRRYIKITVLLMLNLGDSVDRISTTLGIHINTIGNYIETYQKSNLDVYLEDHYLGYSGRFTTVEKEVLKKELDTNIYQSASEICDFILKTFNLKYTTGGLVPLLRKLGYSFKKTKLVPCVADVEAQEKFLKDLETRLSNTNSEDTSVYFADAVHPQHNTKSSYCWTKTGQEREILSVSGRQRLNINAVMNAEDPTDVVVVEGESINAENTWELYQKLEALNPEKKEIIVICDNAKYYKNNVLKERLLNSKIKQIFLPPYSPNLNLIERLWKFMRKEVINTKFYRKFSEFKQNIFNFFENIKTFKDKLMSLISWNFHISPNKTN